MTNQSTEESQSFITLSFLHSAYVEEVFGLNLTPSELPQLSFDAESAVRSLCLKEREHFERVFLLKNFIRTHIVLNIFICDVNLINL